MLNVLVKGIFYVITSLFNLIFSPFFTALYALFPDLATYFNYITTFLNTALTYVSALLNLLCIPETVIVLFFDYLLIKYSIYLINISIKFTIKVYTLLKP